MIETQLFSFFANLSGLGRPSLIFARTIVAKVKAFAIVRNLIPVIYR